MRRTKTIKVVQMVEWANTQLSRTDEYANAKFKSGISAMVESILHSSWNYEGFRFLDNDDSEIGTNGYYSRYYYLPKG